MFLRWTPRPVALGALLAALLASLCACDTSDGGGGATCGDGTELRDGECVAVDDDANNAEPNNAEPNNANNPGLSCGEGTVDDGSGNCVPSDPTVCGPGTTRNEQGECVAEPGRACGEGTVDDGNGNCVSTVEPGNQCGEGTVDDGAGRCVPAEGLCPEGQTAQGGACVALEGLCPAGTLLMDGGCEFIDPTTTAILMDDEPNDPEAGGVPMLLDLLPEGEPLVFWGNLGEPVTLDDGTQLPDLDVFQLVAEPGTRVRVEATPLVPGASLGAAIPNFVAMQYRAKRSEVTPNITGTKTYEFVVPGEEDEPSDPNAPLTALLDGYGGQEGGLVYPTGGQNAAREWVISSDEPYELILSEQCNLDRVRRLTDVCKGLQGYTKNTPFLAAITKLPPVEPVALDPDGFEVQGDLRDVPEYTLDAPAGEYITFALSTVDPDAKRLAYVVVTDQAGNPVPIAGDGVRVPEGGLRVKIDHRVNAFADGAFTFRGGLKPITSLGTLEPGARLETTGISVGNQWSLFGFTVPNLGDGQRLNVTIKNTPADGDDTNAALVLLTDKMQELAASTDGVFTKDNAVTRRLAGTELCPVSEATGERDCSSDAESLTVALLPGYYLVAGRHEGRSGPNDRHNHPLEIEVDGFTQVEPVGDQGWSLTASFGPEAAQTLYKGPFGGTILAALTLQPDPDTQVGVQAFRGPALAVRGQSLALLQDMGAAPGEPVYLELPTGTGDVLIKIRNLNQSAGSSELTVAPLHADARTLELRAANTSGAPLPLGALATGEAVFVERGVNPDDSYEAVDDWFSFSTTGGPIRFKTVTRPLAARSDWDDPSDEARWTDVAIYDPREGVPLAIFYGSQQVFRGGTASGSGVCLDGTCALAAPICPAGWYQVCRNGRCFCTRDRSLSFGLEEDAPQGLSSGSGSDCPPGWYVVCRNGACFCTRNRGVGFFDDALNLPGGEYLVHVTQGPYYLNAIASDNPLFQGLNEAGTNILASQRQAIFGIVLAINNTKQAPASPSYALRVVQDPRRVCESRRLLPPVVVQEGPEGEREVLECALGCGGAPNLAECTGIEDERGNNTPDRARDLGELPVGALTVKPDGHEPMHWFTFTAPNPGVEVCITRSAQGWISPALLESGDRPACDGDFFAVSETGELRYLAREEGGPAFLAGGGLYLLQVTTDQARDTIRKPIIVSKLLACSPGTFACDGNNILACEGGVLEVVETCEGACTLDRANNPSCAFVDDEPRNNTAAGAAPLQLGQSYSARINDLGDVDYFWFNLVTAARNARITFTTGPGVDGEPFPDTTLALCEGRDVACMFGGDNILLQADDVLDQDGNVISPYAMMTWTSPPEGDYVLVVSAKDRSYGGYRLAAEFVQ